MAVVHSCCAGSSYCEVLIMFPVHVFLWVLCYSPCSFSPGIPHSITSVSQKVMGSSTPRCSCWLGTTMTAWYLSTPSSTSPPCSTSSDGAPSRRTLCLYLWTQSLGTVPESPPVRSSRRLLTLMHSLLTVSKYPGSNRSTSGRFV